MPKLFIWDFWYLVKNDRFFCFFLYADYGLSKTNQHHFFSRVGFASATTRPDEVKTMIDSLPYGNFKTILSADDQGEDNTSIWTGDVVKLGNRYNFFYTSRNAHQDPLVQKIFLAESDGLDEGEWRKNRNVIISADGHIYLDKGHPGDLSVHAWRDPYLFLDQGVLYMLLTAKINKVDVDVRYRGCLGLMSFDEVVQQWRHENPIFYNGAFSECEVPEILLNNKNQKVLTFSCWERNLNKAKLSNDLQAGGFYEYNLESGDLRLLLPESSGVYACRVVPFLGAIVGFRVREGGLKIIENNMFEKYTNVPPHLHV